MKLKLLLLFLTCAISIATTGQEFKKGPIIVCPADPNSYDTRVHLREDLTHLFNTESARTDEINFKSNITVNYNGFTEEAETAFQFAVDIWASLLPSDVEIVINADFENLGSGVLGSAGAAFFVRDFRNAPSDTTFYPIALAEKLAGEQLNLEGEPEVFCSFSSTFDFYFGTDGNTPSGQYDFVTIVLHELGHGLGFAGVEGYANGIGNWDYFNNKSARYNEFVELNNGSSFLELENNSTATGDAVVGNNLFFNGDLSVTTLGSRPKLYAPTTYNGGSSFSHLDESTYPAGHEHSLMSPQVGSGESIFDPGVSLDIFADMGWFITIIDHDIDRLVVDNFSDDIFVQIELKSDTNIVSNNLKVVYSYDDFVTPNEVFLVDDENNLYSASIPNPGQQAEVKYYFEGIEDGLGRQVRSPMPAGSSYSVFVRNVATATLPFALPNNGDFENGSAGFFSVPIKGGIDLWQLGAPGNSLMTSGSPANVWKTNLNEDIEQGISDYACALVSPYFNMSDESFNYILSFDLGMELGRDNNLIFDGGPIGANVEVSIDKGQTWQVLGGLADQVGENWYNFQNDGGGTFSTNLFNNEPGWVLDSLNSVSVSYNISRLAGNDNVSFRIVFHSEVDFLEEGYDTDGILIDDFEISLGDPIADFIILNSKSKFFPGEEINFEFISSGATSYLWDFGDGNTSTLENPIHSYTAGGAYDVTLSITYSGGSDVIVKEKFIEVFTESDANYSLTDGGNFEIDNGDFFADNISGTGFERGKSSVQGKDGTNSGDFAWVTGINNNQYQDQSEAFLYTPIFDFSLLGTYTISFFANYDTEQGWDGFVIEYSDDLGQSWNQLDPKVENSWYDEVAVDNPEQGWPAIPLFTGTTGGDFVKKERDISNLGGKGEIIFRFHWLSDFQATEVGIAIDDFELSGPIPGPTDPDFSFSNITGCDGQQVTFTNESSGSITEIEWDFGANASPGTATGLGPHVVTYTGTGSSTVSLTVTNPENDVYVEEKIDIINTSPLHEPTIERTYNGDGTYTLQTSLADSYQWLRNGEILTGETNQSLSVDLGDGGEFSVIVTVGFCIVEAESLVVNSILTRKIKIYPNPVTDYLTIKTGGVIGDFTIYNTSGKILMAGSLAEDEVTINLLDFENGLYFLRIDAVNEELINRVLINR